MVGVGEDWLEVRDGTASRRAEFDPWPAKVAADRAFVDAVPGRPVDPDTSPPDYAEALRSHRLACAVARSAASGGGRSSVDDGDRALVVEEPGRAAVRGVAPTEGPVAVRTRFSGLSAGTELSFLNGTNPALTPRTTRSSACSAPTGPAPATRSTGSATWRSPR